MQSCDFLQPLSIQLSYITYTTYTTYHSSLHSLLHPVQLAQFQRPPTLFLSSTFPPLSPVKSPSPIAESIGGYLCGTYLVSHKARSYLVLTQDTPTQTPFFQHPDPQKKPSSRDRYLETMSGIEAIANVVVRQAAGTAAATLAAAATAKPACSPDNDFDGRIGLRISSIFVILVGSVFGESSQPSPIEQSYS